MTCTEVLHKEAATVFQLSGHYFNKLGQYYRCVETPNYKYYHTEFGGSHPHGFFGSDIGLCLPDPCDIKDLNNTINDYFTTNKIDLFVEAVRPQPEMYQYDKGIVYAMFQLIVITSILLALIATLLKNKKGLLGAFNVTENLKKLKTLQRRPLDAIDGVKALMTMWVVFGHSFSLQMTGISNGPTIEKKLEEPFYLWVQGAPLGVDCFFYIAGFLTVVSLLKRHQITTKQFFAGVLYRAMRLWPIYILMIMFYYSHFMRLADGPRWGDYEGIVGLCNYFLKTILFVDNFVHNGELQCMGWGWYLQNDMQLYTTVLLVFLLLGSNVRWAQMGILALLFGCLYYTYSFVVSHQVKHITHIYDFEKWDGFFQAIYIKPMSRGIGYMTGALYGSFYHYLAKGNSTNSVQSILQKNRCIRVLVELTGLTLILFMILIPRTLQVFYSWSFEVHGIFFSFGKVVFLTGITLLAGPSMLGVKKSLIGKFLTNSVFLFLAKLSFTMYLSHLLLINYWEYSRTYEVAYAVVPHYPLFFGQLVIGYSFAFLLSLFFEIPCQKLQNLLMAQGDKPTVKTQHMTPLPSS